MKLSFQNCKPSANRHTHIHTNTHTYTHMTSYPFSLFIFYLSTYHCILYHIYLLIYLVYCLWNTISMTFLFCLLLHHKFLKYSKMKVKVKSLSCVQLFMTPWTVAYQAPQSMEFSRQEYWSGLPFPSPGDLPSPGIEPGSPALQADTSSSQPPGKPQNRVSAQ